ncbi:MAG: homocysteine S-methyltransferase family protein [Candidatus Omnitrophota bacterium]
MAKTLREKIKKEILLLDGAFGTYIQELGLKKEDFKDNPGGMEYLSISSPQLIKKIHCNYLEAGSDAVETNTFGGNILKLKEYGLQDKVYDLNFESARLARSAADEFSINGHSRYVVGTMGPTGKLPSSSDPDLGAITYKELKSIYYDQALGIIDGGADALLIETGQDLLEMKAAVNGAKLAIANRGKDLVVMAQCTLANNGRMLLGSEISAVTAVLSCVGVDAVGINCSSGPLEMEGAIEFLSKNCPVWVSVVPNAGLPVESDGKAVYQLGSLEMSGIIERFLEKYNIDIIGGCCGTTPGHIKEMRKVIKKKRVWKKSSNILYSGFYSGFDFKEKKRPILVGERINTQGSRKMKELLKDGDYDGIIELGKQQ